MILVIIQFMGLLLLIEHHAAQIGAFQNILEAVPQTQDICRFSDGENQWSSHVTPVHLNEMVISGSCTPYHPAADDRYLPYEL